MARSKRQPARIRNRHSAVLWLGALGAGLIMAAIAAAAGVRLAPTFAPPLHPVVKPRVALTQTQCAEKLPTSVLVGQVLMVGLLGNQLSLEAGIFRQYHVGGAVIMSSPADPHDGSILIFKRDGGNTNNPVLIATDEEGGIVQRFAGLGALAAPADIARTFSPEQAEAMVAMHGAKLKTIGVDMVLGPLADVAPEQGASALGNRIFSNDPDVVSQYAAAYLRGWQAAGLLPTLKHFPGMGSATGNTDFQPATTPPLATLTQRDFIPYQRLTASGTAVMIGNQNVPGWFSGPASLSPVVNAYLRNVLGYANTLVITDSLDAAAITSTSTIPDAVVRAITAGNDMVIIVAPDPDTSTGSLNLGFITQAEAALEHAVQNGMLSKHQLAVSVARKLTAQHVQACSLAP